MINVKIAQIRKDYWKICNKWYILIVNKIFGYKMQEE